MEGILTVGLQVPNAERLRAVHGDDHRRLLGSVVLRCRLHDDDGPLSSISSSSDRFSRTSLRRRVVLRDLSVRSSHSTSVVLET